MRPWLFRSRAITTNKIEQMKIPTIASFNESSLLERERWIKFETQPENRLADIPGILVYPADNMCLHFKFDNAGKVTWASAYTLSEGLSKYRTLMQAYEAVQSVN